jgi:SAM-dependent methyltransferase
VDSAPRGSHLPRSSHQPVSSAPLFFAASKASDIATAFRLSGLQPGQRLLDLGCGDGRVMEAACDAGALAVGVELDPMLVARARQRLAGRPAVVHHDNLFTVDLRSYDPGVVFAFLTHSVLQTITRQIELLRPGTIVVTVGSPVPGWIPARSEADVFAYELPVQYAQEPAQPGWLFPGFAARLPPARPMVTSFLAAHPPGAVSITPGPGLGGALIVRTGLVELDRISILGVDIYWPPQPAGTCLEGVLLSESLGELPVVCFYCGEGPYGSSPFDLTTQR